MAKKEIPSDTKNSKLKTLAIAYEFSRCHGYGINESEVEDMWEETNLDKDKVSTKGIDAYSGNSSSEIANMIVQEILKNKI